MCFLINLINIVNDTDFVLYSLIIILIILALILFYLFFTQNKIKIKNDSENDKTRNYNKIDEVEKPALVEIVEDEIPDKLDYTQALWQNDLLDLQDITRELEKVPKEKTINMTDYETKQEEEAIISYDELISRKSESLRYDENTNDYLDDVIVKQVDLNSTSKRELIDDEIGNYEHEEAFLEALKQLQKIMN